MLRKNVHHSGSEPAVRNDRHLLLFCALVQRLLLEHDLGVSAEIAEVHARVHRAHRHVVVEVIREGAHHGIAIPHQRRHSVAVSHVERRRNQPMTGILREKRRQVADANVFEPSRKLARSVLADQTTIGMLRSRERELLEHCPTKGAHLPSSCGRAVGDDEGGIAR